MIISGKAWWAKVVGPAPKGKFGYEWSIDVCQLDAETIKMLKTEGVKKSYFKNEDDERGTYITLRRKATRKNKIDKEIIEPAEPISIVDEYKKPWDSRKIGNGSDINVMLGINDYVYEGVAGKKPSIIAIQVTNLIPYEGKGGFTSKYDVDDETTGNKDKW